MRGLLAVRKEHDYRHNAAETLELANKASTSANKGRLVRLAEKWLDLADRAHRPRRSSQQLGEHPLVKKTLGDDQQEME
jgi:hypothetical protein